MKKSRILIIVLCACTLKVSAQVQPAITAEELKSWCYYLASDEMKGRRNGSPEMKMAADTIAACFHAAGLKPFSQATGYFQEYNTKGWNRTTIAERNVIGILEGSDPILKHEWIVLSAHFDHIGIGKPVNGDSIFNGADDNATGTVTLMGLSKLLGQSPIKPKRSILFVAFSGEELGLKGSKWFMEHLPMPEATIKLNLNFEMEGESASLGKNRYILTGDAFTDFDDLLDQYNANTDWQVAKKYQSGKWVFYASDNASMALKQTNGKSILNIPAFTLVTTDDVNIVHKVTDEPQHCDYENMASLVNYLSRLIPFLAANPLNIHWNENAFENTNR